MAAVDTNTRRGSRFDPVYCESLQEEHSEKFVELQ